MDDSSDSDSENVMFPNIGGATIVEWGDDEKPQIRLDVKSKIELCVIRKDIEELRCLPVGEGMYEIQVKGVGVALLEGRYSDAVLSSRTLCYDNIVDLCQSGDSVPVPDKIRTYMLASIKEAGGPNVEYAALECLLLGYAYYELYCQCNYTGPELSRYDMNRLMDESIVDSLHASALKGLESDGNYPFKGCELPHLLLVARSVLAAVSDLTRAPWQHGIELDPHGEIMPIQNREDIDVVCARAMKSLRTRHWLSARAVLVHTRLLQKQSYMDNPTLFKECQDLFRAAESEFEDILASDWLTTQDSDNAVGVASSSSSVCLVPKSGVGALMQLEKGLSLHYFDEGDKVSCKPNHATHRHPHAASGLVYK
jgi:hypothetical protein